MTHQCPDCGLEHQVDVPEPVIVDAEPAADAVVQVAQIEADRDVTIARLGAKTEQGWQEQRIAELEGQLTGMQEMLARLNPPEPEPEPVPVVVQEPEPEPVVEEPVAAPPPIVEEQPKKTKRGNPWWG